MTRSKTQRQRRSAVSPEFAKLREAADKAMAENLATLDELVERLAERSERKHLIAGHTAGPDAFYAARRKGMDWAVVDNNTGRRTPDFWDGTEWRPLREDTPDAEMYLFDEQQANDLAAHYAELASEVHRRHGAMLHPDFARWLAGEAAYVVAAVREQVA